MSLTPAMRATSLAAAIRAKMPMIALLGGPKQTAKVESAIRELADAQIGFVRIGNPLGSPMSLEQLVQQITGDDTDAVPRDDTERVLRALIARSNMRRQVVVLVQQAETLAPEALEFLHGLPGLSHPGLAPVQVALVGASALGARIADNRTYIIRDPADPAPVAAVETPTPGRQASRPEVMRKGQPRAALLLLAGLGLFGIVAILFLGRGSFTPRTVTPTKTEATSSPIVGEPQQAATPTPQAVPVAPSSQTAGQQATAMPPAPAEISPQASPATLPVPGPPAASPPASRSNSPPASRSASSPASRSASSPPASSSALPPASLSASPPETAASARGRLFRDFSAFLNTRSLGRRLSQAERTALLEEYLARHQVASSTSPAATSSEFETFRIPGEPRVLLFFASGSDPDRAAAEHQADLLRERVAGLELQPADTVPKVPTIRYEYPADRAAALALAETTWAQGGDWQVEDLTASPTRPEPGTIEMWLPRL